MKIFISWSGEFSQKVASALKEWMPCVIQSIEVFFSPDDIEKGEKWDGKISSELNDCKFGIVCLTNQNVNAPWVHFEAGALSKTLDSKVSALMLNIKPSDIKGPLSRFQATKFDKEDFFKLLKTINNNNEQKLDEEVLKRTFDAMWDKIDTQISKLISEYETVDKKEVVKKDVSKHDSQAIEEILQILREQRNILSNPENLLPINYFNYIMNNINIKSNRALESTEFLYKELYDYIYYLKDTRKNGINEIIDQIINIILESIRRCNDTMVRKTWENKFRNLGKFNRIFVEDAVKEISIDDFVNHNQLE